MTRSGTVYAKAGCPFTFRFLLFLNDVDHLPDYEVRVARPGEASYTEIVGELEAATGEKASFPSMKMNDGTFLVGSERLIAWVAEKQGVEDTSSPIVDYFNENMAPVTRQLLQQLREARTRLEALES